MSQIRIVAVSAGAEVPSRTTSVVRLVAEKLSQRLGASLDMVELSAVAPSIFGSLSRSGLDTTGEALVRSIEQSDILVVGSPVYRASYTGLFKHLFDLVDHRALTGRVVLLTATGGSLEHSLVIEHQFRPLFGFFGAVTVPTGVYAQRSDFADGALASQAVLERVAKAVDEAAFLSGFPS